MVYEMGFIDFLGNSRVNACGANCFGVPGHMMQKESTSLLTDKVLHHILVRKLRGCFRCLPKAYLEEQLMESYPIKVDS
jgi:hypothetical protein